MGLQPQNRRQAVRTIYALAVVGGLFCWWISLPPPPDPWIMNLTNNPDKFFLWGAPTNINYSFTYDPHAADEWRFEQGVLPSWPPTATNGGQ